MTSRIYGGWANGSVNGCINPEPFAYELGFTYQRAIVAQINQDANITNNDLYSGQLDYLPDNSGHNNGHAPWFDWAPYLWADGTSRSPGTGLYWCDYSTQGLQQCAGTPGDVRFGDQDMGYTQYFGDQIHPTGWGTMKVATQLLKWLQGSLPSTQLYLSDWITPWIQK